VNHSPEPWKALEAMPEHDVPWRIIAPNRNICIVHKEDEAAENAQRIVACVNACKGIPTETLTDKIFCLAVVGRQPYPQPPRRFGRTPR